MPEPRTPLSERPWEDVERMLGVDEVLQRILASVAPLPAVTLPLLDGLGLVAAGDVVARDDVPPFRNSAMDGFAVRAIDTQGASTASPVRLRVIANLAAGYDATVTIESGTAARIMTGAPMPSGADAVVRFEETDEAGHPRSEPVDATVRLHRAAKAWDNVRPAGEDVRAGERIVTKGTLLRPAELGMLAALGWENISVHRRPRVAIVSTGDEVVAGGGRLAAGQIRDANSTLLAAMVLRAGGEPVTLGVARDTVEDLTGKLAVAAGADLIVSSGGVSLGDYDMVKDVLRAEGEIGVWQVRMKPGKPLAFGRIGGTPLLGLPGNPVAAAVSFLLFGLPAIRRMLGREELSLPSVRATLRETIDNRGQRRHYVRAFVRRADDGSLEVATAGQQGAGVLSSLARANGLLVIPESLDLATPGMTLEVLMVDWDLGPTGDALVGPGRER